MKILFLIFIFWGVANCKPLNEESYEFEFDCSNGSQTKHIRLAKVRNYQKMIVLENTLNDSCKIGVMLVPPSKLGILYKIEFLMDCISYNFNPYKASKGKLIIRHVFSDQ